MFFIDLKVNNKKLDKYQKKVVKSKAKNLLVVAGAGSGKTFTIVAKIKKLIIEGTLPEEILCISFTRDSAKSLEEKLKEENIFIKVKTFHSLGYEIIKKHKNVNLISDNLLENIIEKKLKKEKHLKEIANAKFIRLGYPDPIFNKIENNIILNSKSKERLKEITKTFINLYKSNNHKTKDFKEFEKLNDKKHIYDQKKRHNYFIKLIKSIIIEYEKELKKHHQIDYHDMINKSIEIVKKIDIEKYKYIIIDEYQDTSLNKNNLIKEIQKKSGAKLLAVGDDWQSIYSFTGSNLEIFTNFNKVFPNAKIIKLKKTYRNSKELLKITRKFICKNKKQIYKRLTSKKSNKNPIYIYYYKNNIKEIWNEIVKKTENQNSLILGRNNKDLYKIPYIPPEMQFLTIHKSKGLESENTIIINLEDNYDSLPSKINDSEYLMYVKPKSNDYKYAEERRLFYVALTRCKNNNYLLVKKESPSIFIDEMKKIGKNNIIVSK